MGKIHLCCQKYGRENWFVLEEGVDYIGAMHDGKVSMIHTVDFMQADSMTDLLHKLQDSEDDRWYVVSDFLDSRNQTRREEYPHHRELHILTGYLPKACDFQIDRTYLSKWEVRYKRELWVQLDDSTMVKVQKFSDKMDRDLMTFIAKEGLKFEI